MKQLTTISQTKSILTIDALRYTLNLEGKAFSSLRRTLRSIESKVDNGTRVLESSCISAIGSAWQIVDTVHRVRHLISRTPGLKQNEIPVQLFLRETHQIVELRNFYQHLDGSISRLNGKTNPIMGVVSWVAKDSQKAITLFVGSYASDIEARTLVYDTQDTKFVQQLLFSAGNKEVELDKTHFSCVKIKRYLNSWLRSNSWLSSVEMEPTLLQFSRNEILSI